MKVISEQRRKAGRGIGLSSRLENDRTSLMIKGRQVSVSHLNKVLYPKAGFSKGQVIDYYIRIAPVLLPYLRERPLTLKRYPNGVEAPFFYEKHCPGYRPEWVDTATVWSKENAEEISFCVVNDIAALVWAANLGDLELHTSLAKRTNIESPTTVVFDLDPGAPANVLQCAQVGLWLRGMLDQAGLQPFVKTSGSKGLQVYVPLNSPTTYEITKAFARKVAEGLEEQHPESVVSKMRKDLRKGKVLVDWSQNDTHKTTICVYSLRARELPTVSTPVSWREVENALKKGEAEKLSFLPDQVLKRVEKQGDLFAPVLTTRQKLPIV